MPRKFGNFNDPIIELAHKDLERDPAKNSKNRNLEKFLKPDDSPVFDKEDEDGEELINKNDPERKFVPIEDVADPDSGFLDTEENEENEKEEIREIEEVDDTKRIEEVRNDIDKYTHKQRGSEFGPLESFHINHDDQETISVSTPRGKIKEARKQDINDDFLLEESFATNKITGNRKISRIFTDEYKSGRTRDRSHNNTDNLKKWNDNKKERASRGVIREYLDQSLELPEEIAREEAEEKLRRENKSIFRRFFGRLN